MIPLGLPGWDQWSCTDLGKEGWGGGGKKQSESDRWGCTSPSHSFHTNAHLESHTNFQVHTCIHAYLMPDKAELQCQGACLFIHFTVLISLPFLSVIFLAGEKVCEAAQLQTVHRIFYYDNKKKTFI